MQPLEHPGLVFRSLDPNGTDEESLLRGWFQAMRRGFHQGRGSDEGFRTWVRGTRADTATLTGAWVEDTAVGDGTIPVATFASWAGRINSGRDVLPLHMISDVTVAPTHRRQGLLRKLMTVSLADAVAAGLPLAGLTVSEGGIYGRYGFGLATHLGSIEVDLGPRFGFRPEVSLGDGSLVLAEPAEAWPSVASVFAAWLERTRGAVDRPSFYEPMLTSRYDFEANGEEKRRRVAVHLAADGTADGYAIYRIDEAPDAARNRWVHVDDLIGLSPTTYLRLWRYIADIDLVHRASFRHASVADPLSWALAEPHVVRRTSDRTDMLWLRLLDLPRALEARPWYDDGRVVIGVDDDLGHIAGSWEISVSGGEAKVARTDAVPEATLAADTIGALYLGGVSVPTLAAAGRIRGTGVETLANLADGGEAPYCTTSF